MSGTLLFLTGALRSAREGPAGHGGPLLSNPPAGGASAPRDASLQLESFSCRFVAVGGRAGSRGRGSRSLRSKRGTSSRPAPHSAPPAAPAPASMPETREARARGTASRPPVLHSRRPRSGRRKHLAPRAPPHRPQRQHGRTQAHAQLLAEARLPLRPARAARRRGPRLARQDRGAAARVQLHGALRPGARAPRAAARGLAQAAALRRDPGTDVRPATLGAAPPTPHAAPPPPPNLLSRPSRSPPAHRAPRPSSRSAPAPPRPSTSCSPTRPPSAAPPSPPAAAAAGCWTRAGACPASSWAPTPAPRTS